MMSTSSKFTLIIQDFAPYLDASPPKTAQRLSVDLADRLVDAWCICLGIDYLKGMEALRDGLARALGLPIVVELQDWFGLDYYGECTSDGTIIRVRVRLDGDWHYREHNEAHELGHILLFHVTHDRIGQVRRGHRATTIQEQNTELVAAALLRRARRDRIRAAPTQRLGLVTYLTEMFWERWLP